MQIFYAPDISGSVHTLAPGESKHLVRVLRMKQGDIVRLIDGKGNIFEGLISDPDPTGCKIEITSFTSDFEKRGYRLHIAISPLKNPDRFEWFAEKSVEIGIDEITPLICRNTEKTGFRTERINNLIVAAMKQSVRALRPVLNIPVSFGEFIKEESGSKKMIAHCNTSFGREMIASVCRAGDDAVIMIGPEGDFSSDEISLAMEKGYTGIDLGRSRLRTETAGIAACHSVYLINQG